MVKTISRERSGSMKTRTGRAFKMKGTTQKEETPKEEPPPREEPPREAPFRMKAEPPNIKYDLPKKEQQPILNSGGLDKAYKQGDVYGKKYCIRSRRPYSKRRVRRCYQNSKMSVRSRGAQPNRRYNEHVVGSSGIWNGRPAKIRTFSKSIRIP